jgi:hypothetical protein
MVWTSRLYLTQGLNALCRPVPNYLHRWILSEMFSEELGEPLIIYGCIGTEMACERLDQARKLQAVKRLISLEMRSQIQHTADDV